MVKYLVSFDARGATEVARDAVYQMAHSNGGYHYYKSNGSVCRLPSTTFFVNVDSSDAAEAHGIIIEKLASLLKVPAIHLVVLPNVQNGWQTSEKVDNPPKWVYAALGLPEKPNTAVPRTHINPSLVQRPGVKPVPTNFGNYRNK